MSNQDQASPEQRKQEHDQCVKWKQEILQENNVMKFMLKQMSDIKCKLTSQHFICRRCDIPISGRFDHEEGIILCEDNIKTKQQLADTMIHETIHAFDHCRVNIDWTNCEHIACSEIRAANLSGDCGILNEFFRGKLSNFKKHHQDCVKRRALLSLECNEQCKEGAKETVDRLFDKCFKDFEPFDDIY